MKTIQCLLEAGSASICILAVHLLIFSSAAAQTDQQLSSYLKRNPDADTNGDGILTREEAKRHRNSDPSRGGNLASVSEIPGIEISLEAAPMEVVELQSPDGVNLDFVWRRPGTEGPLPTIVFFHGGGGQSNIDGLKRNLMNGAIQTRFLEKGYIIVQSTRRPYWIGKDKDSLTGFFDAVNDAALVVQKVKALPGVDPDRIILYGGSGGGILAITTAAEVKVAAVVAGEPATVALLDPRTGQSASPATYRDLMENPQSMFTGERKKTVQQWLNRVTAPVLVLQGNRTGLYKTNFEILIPEMKRIGKDISFIEFPGMSHGFYWGTRKTGATLETVEKILRDVDRFIRDNT